MSRARVRYRDIAMDNARWDGFAFRDGDIIISTPPKCGTTWTQMICGLLIFQTPNFPLPLDRISPWFEMLTRDRDDVAADLEAQTHRRFIKSHTSFDGLPDDERVTYICVGRDPRDVAMSWDNHMRNLDISALLALREKTVGLDDLAELFPDGIPVPAETELDRFWEWIETDPEKSAASSGLAGTLHHLSTFWAQRHRQNFIFLHYSELKADLEGQMRSLADKLGLHVDEAKWPELVHAATFEEMRRRAVERAPNATEPIWLDTQRFFNHGTNGQWKDVLSAHDLVRYEAPVRELIDDELSSWVHQGPIRS